MRPIRIYVSLLVFISLLLGYNPSAAPVTFAAPSLAQHGEHFRYYPQTGHNIAFEIKDFFDAHGGVGIFGFPITEVISDTHTGLQVQYFERARFELHPDMPPEHHVSLTLVGSLLTHHRTDPPFQWLAESPDPARDFFPQSGHTLGGAFKYAWHTHGGLEIFGYPISEEFFEINPDDGENYLVQYFQRARFEYHPEFQGTPHEIQLGSLGKQLLELRPDSQALIEPSREIALLGQATTSYAASINERIHNIGRATDMFNGLIVPPNTEFSFNSVSDFEKKDGFVDGYAIMGGRLERVAAGGLCQVSTTFFRAVSNAGLRIIERHGHSFIVNFYENILGFDATVFKPELDFRWYNDTSGPVYVFTNANPDTAEVTFWIWGYHDGRTVSYEGPYTSNWQEPGPAIWEYDPNMPPGAINQLVHGRSGTEVTYIRTVTMPDGTVLHHDVYYTNYQPWEDFYVYGPGAR